MKFIKNEALAFAPATIGNVGVGFDVLGMAIEGTGDFVALRIRDDSKIVIKKIVTNTGEPHSLPLKAHKNTATAALKAIQKGENLKLGFDVVIKKGIPLGSGMGGSAASAVAAVVAYQALLKKKLSMKELFYYALAGEKIASGAAHPDNVAPALSGGLCLSSLMFSDPLISIPIPKNLAWLLVHPDIKVETKKARKILAPIVTLEKYVQQSGNLACFLSGFFKNDLNLIKQGFSDVIIEPQRAHLIPDFVNIQQKITRDQQVLGMSISGSGPSLFAFVKNQEKAKKIAKQIQNIFLIQKIKSQVYVGLGPAKGAQEVIFKKWKFENEI